MTINDYYVVFGFAVKKKDYMKMEGFTIDKVPDDVKKECIAETGIEDDAFIAAYWFNNYYFDDMGYASSKILQIKGTDFIVRSFTHDNENHDEYLIIGIEIAQIDNFTGGVKALDPYAKEHLQLLMNKPQYAELIQASEDKNGWSGKDYGIRSKKYDNLCIIPTTWIMQNDCSCCS